jgi:hypothetical protein
MRRLLITIFFLLATTSASACPVCAARTRDDSTSKRWVLAASTFGMILLPMGMISGLAIWLRRR